jgi:hypothetical protein
MNVLSSLGTGVVAGLVATLLTIAIRSYWISVILPWYEEHLYHGAKIEGRWVSTIRYSEDVDDWDKCLMDLRRNGHRVSATLQFIGGVNCGNTYDIEGEFRDLLLTATYSSKVDPLVKTIFRDI